MMKIEFFQFQIKDEIKAAKIEGTKTCNASTLRSRRRVNKGSIY